MEIREISPKTIDVQEYFQEWEKTNNPFYPDDMKWDRAKVKELLSDIEEKLFDQNEQLKEQLEETFMQITDIELKIVDDPEEQTRAYVSVMVDNALFLGNIRLIQVCDKFLFDYPAMRGLPGDGYSCFPTSSDFRTQLEEAIITAYKAEFCDIEGCEDKADRGGHYWTDEKYWKMCIKHLSIPREGKPQPKMKQEAINRESKEKDSDPRFTWCDVEGCKANVEFGGTYWKGYWNLCYKHLSTREEGKPLPKMKEEAIERERMRDKKINKL